MQSLWKKRVVGKWKVKERVGVGTYASVWRVQHRKTSVQAALKVFDLRYMAVEEKELGNVECARLSTELELELLQELEHPHIVQLLEVQRSKYYIYAVLELVEGGELHSYLQKKGRLSEEEARHYFRQLLTAIEYCHAHLILHRDLKLENILLDAGKRNIKLIDFGLGQKLIPGRLCRSCCGSLDYVAPEILQREGYVGPAVDVWSMGVVLYALLHGYLPFSGFRGQRSCRQAICEGRYYVSSPDFSSNCVVLLYNLLERDPDQRIRVEDLRSNCWVTEDGAHSLPCYLPRYKPLPAGTQPDPTLVCQLCYFGFQPEKFVPQIQAGVHCQAVALYHCLHKRQAASPTLTLSTPYPTFG